MSASIRMLPLLQKLLFFITSIGVFISVVSFFRVFRSSEKRLYLLWIVPIFWQLLGESVEVLWGGKFLALVTWRVGLVGALLCTLVSGWLFVRLWQTKEWDRYRKVILPGVALQIALVVSALVYGF